MAFTSSAVPLQLTGCTAGASQLLPYCFTINLQGDIMAILDAAGNTVVQYAYDAWGGKKTTTGSMAGTLGYLNPFRYRGYVWDEETSMYYLRSRYYYPELQRFIIEDTFIGKKDALFQHNLFAYCTNNPITFVDYSGHNLLMYLFDRALYGRERDFWTVVTLSLRAAGLNNSADLLWNANQLGPKKLVFGDDSAIAKKN